MKKKILIEGMSCEHCVAHVKDALEGIDGVASVLVNLEGKYAGKWTCYFFDCALFQYAL